jgi:hypothetical protein
VVSAGRLLQESFRSSGDPRDLDAWVEGSPLVAVEFLDK